MRDGKCVEPSAPEQMGRKVTRCKDLAKGSVQNIESARVGAERRHHHAVRAGGKAASHDDVAAPTHPRTGMQVAGEAPEALLAEAEARLVREAMQR